MAASVVLGQADFEGMHTGTSSNMLSEPYDVKVDGAGNLWVADTDNNRVLEYATTAVPEFGPITVAALAASIAVLVAIASRMRPVFF